MDERKRELFRGDEAFAWALFARAPAVRFAAVTSENRMLSRVLHAVVVEGRLCFHGGDEGEKLALLGREAVASCEDVVAEIPSYWIHPELACPATTYYESALADGRIERIDDARHKARVLEALMRRFQPEGRYAPIDASDPRYRKVLDRLLVAQLVPTRVRAKRKLGQHRTAAQIERVLEGLFERGASGDLRAIRTIAEAHPARPLPAFLRGPLATELCVAPDEHDARAVAALLDGLYWTAGFSPEQLAEAQLRSTAWLVARERGSGAVLGSVRAVSDDVRYAYVLDCVVRPDLRRRGIGRALMELLLRHPRMRSVAHVSLRTRDAQALYRRLGFTTSQGSTEPMALTRAPYAGSSLEQVRAR